MSSTTHQFDAIILGGGIAGLWILSRLRSRGYEAILIEKEQLGSGQTFASQGMIHGGIKYSLGGAMTGASESIAQMPARWRSCLEGKDSVNLTGVRVLSDAYYMFSDARLSSKMTAFFGSKAIEGRVTMVAAADYPEVFRSPRFKGLLYKLQDLVLDTRSLVTHLHNQLSDYIFEGSPQFEQLEGNLLRLSLGGELLGAGTYVLAAGRGNGEIISDLKLKVPMQLRPLHQVMVKGKDLPDLFAHAVSLKAADKPRITFTTHVTGQSRVWYLGGQLAESGVTRSADEQIAFAKQELNTILPWMDLNDADFPHRPRRGRTGHVAAPRHTLCAQARQCRCMLAYQADSCPHDGRHVHGTHARAEYRSICTARASVFLYWTFSMGVKLGHCDLEIGRISLGTVKFGRNTDVKYQATFSLPEDEVIIDLLSAARELGVNLLDTAPAYGTSEQRIGQLLPGSRQDWVLCTKAGETYAGGKSIYDFSEQAVTDSVARSLRLLKTDYLDIVLIHSDGDDLGILNQTDALPALERLKDRGDIRYIGMSTKSVEGSIAALTQCDVIMLTLNLDDQSHLDVIQAAEQKGTGVLLKKVFASGHRPVEDSLAFVLGQPGVHSAVVGTIDPGHLRANVSMAEKLQAARGP